MLPPAVRLSAKTRAGLEALTELAGRVVREDVVERIFSRFCVGK